LLEDGYNKVLEGLTTLEELLRVLGPVVEHGYKCSECGAKLDLKYVACPHCGAAQKQFCPGCHSRIEKDWKACPYCGRKL
jgi:RNA polymerase subunit RPABC4/transcription elongation factor Spt4